MVSTVIGLFGSYAEAQRVVQDLVERGYMRDDIRVIPEEGTAPIPTATESVGGRVPGVDTKTEVEQNTTAEASVAVALIEMGMPERKAVYYSEAVRRGGVLVCVSADEAKVAELQQIIDAHGSLDINNQASLWREKGWIGVPEEEADVVVVQTSYVCDPPSRRRWAS